VVVDEMKNRSPVRGDIFVETHFKNNQSSVRSDIMLGLKLFSGCRRNEYAAPTELAILCVWFYKDSAPNGARKTRCSFFMEVATFKNKFSELFSFKQEGEELVGSSGNVELRLVPYLDNAKMLSSASLIYPYLQPENEDTRLGAIASVLFLALATGDNKGLDRWIQNAAAKFAQDGIYDETRDRVLLRLSSVDQMFYLSARFDSFR
jgi:hypothetical protein